MDVGRVEVVAGLAATSEDFGAPEPYNTKITPNNTTAARTAGPISAMRLLVLNVRRFPMPVRVRSRPRHLIPAGRKSGYARPVAVELS